MVQRFFFFPCLGVEQSWVLSDKLDDGWAGKGLSVSVLMFFICLNGFLICFNFMYLLAPEEERVLLSERTVSSVLGCIPV